MWFAFLVSGRFQGTPITLALAPGHMDLQGGWPGQPQPPGTAGFVTSVRTATGQGNSDHFSTGRLGAQPACNPTSSNTGTGRPGCGAVTDLQSLWQEQSFDLGALPRPLAVGLILNAFWLQELQNALRDHARGAGTVSHSVVWFCSFCRDKNGSQVCKAAAQGQDDAPHPSGLWHSISP